MVGADTELDRQVLDLVKDPLTHLVRNCADHGIENPDERSAAGKLRRGTIRLTASRQGGYVVIEIADDGRGLDTARIKAKALEAGLIGESEISAKSQAEINNLIFAPGFSTALEVTSISGRGVGMDIVRSNIEQIGGTVDVKSSPGSGTSFVIKNSADACHCRRSDRRDSRRTFRVSTTVSRPRPSGRGERIHHEAIRQGHR
jgi:two-component system chemotaxis sensor kinase CheA